MSTCKVKYCEDAITFKLKTPMRLSSTRIRKINGIKYFEVCVFGYTKRYVITGNAKLVLDVSQVRSGDNTSQKRQTWCIALEIPSDDETHTLALEIGKHKVISWQETLPSGRKHIKEDDPTQRYDTYLQLVKKINNL